MFLLPMVAAWRRSLADYRATPAGDDLAAFASSRSAA